MSLTKDIWKSLWPKWLYDKVIHCLQIQKYQIKYLKVRNVMVFSPSDPFKLWQQPPQRSLIPELERYRGYRYPAPGSYEPAVISNRETLDEFYDTKKYATDPRNLPKNVLTLISIYFGLIYI